MINRENITQVYPTINQKDLPKVLKQAEYQFLVDNIDLYNDDEDIKAFIDTFIEKLNRQLKTKDIEVENNGEIKQNPVQPNYNKVMKRIDNIPKYEEKKTKGSKKNKEYKSKFKKGQDLYWFDNDGTLIKERIKEINYQSNGEPIYKVLNPKADWEYSESNIIEALKGKRMFLKYPAKAVAKLSPEAAFIKRYSQIVLICHIFLYLCVCVTP